MLKRHIASTAIRSIDNKPVDDVPISAKLLSDFSYDHMALPVLQCPSRDSFSSIDS